MVPILLFVLAVTAPAQSLRERAKREGGTATSSKVLDFLTVRISELPARSNIVLHGRVISERTLLSSNESFVVTEYRLAPIHFLKPAKPVNVPRPGEMAPVVVVRREGGRLIERGYTLTTEVAEYPESESFRVDDEVVVFLEFDSTTKVYRLTAGPFGAFRVAGGRVEPMTQQVAIRRGDQPIATAAFLSDVERMISNNR